MAHAKKGSMKKVVKSKVAALKWLWWSDNDKNFNSNNSSEFWCRFPVGGGITNLPELLLLKILPLSDHYSHFWATIFDFTTFFMLPFLHGPHLFFTVWLFLCRYIVCILLVQSYTVAARKITQFLSFAKLLISVGISFAPTWNLANTPITDIGQNLQAYTST